MIPPYELEQLWSQHAAELRLLAQMRTDSADDCVQEAFVRLSQQSSAPLDPLAWLARVVRNLALTELRTDRRRRRREAEKSRSDDRWFMVDSQSIDGHGPCEVEWALRQLAPEFRELVVAVIWNHMTFRQIADAFDMTSATAHRRYREALEELRRILQSDQPTDDMCDGDEHFGKQEISYDL